MGAALTQKKIDKIRECYSSGATDAEIMKQCGVCRASVYRWRRTLGPANKKPKIPKSPAKTPKPPPLPPAAFPSAAPEEPEKIEDWMPMANLRRETRRAKALGVSYGQYKASQYQRAHPEIFRWRV